MFGLKAHVYSLATFICFAEDPIAKRFTDSQPEVLSENKDVAKENDNSLSAFKVLI